MVVTLTVVEEAQADILVKADTVEASSIVRKLLETGKD